MHRLGSGARQRVCGRAGRSLAKGVRPAACRRVILYGKSNGEGSCHRQQLHRWRMGGYVPAGVGSAVVVA